MAEVDKKTENFSNGEKPKDIDVLKAKNKLGLSDRALIFILMVAGFLSHAYNMFFYPIYLGDEGIYMEQAWAVIRQAKLAPYTYFYDHAPAGWLLIAAWIYLLPAKFHQFGMAINSGRVLMLILHVISVALLYRIAKKMSGSDVGAFLAGLVFTLSPLSIYYQRMVLLDNMMVFWLLLSLYFLIYNAGRLSNVILSSLFFGVALLTKENAIFFIPVIAYMVYLEVKNTYRFRFALAGWVFMWSSVLSIYPLYAFLKDELLPAGSNFLLTSSPEQHVSLVSTLIWQLSRKGPSLLDPTSQFWVFFDLRWWPRDAVMIGVGIFAIILNLLIGFRERKRNPARFVASGLALSYGFYLVRGSVMLEFYLAPLLPFLALNIGILIASIFSKIPRAVATPIFAIGVLVLSASYIYTARDHYTLNMTQLQANQLQWIRTNVPPSATIAIDDDLWVDLHEKYGRLPVYPNAHSYSKIQGDPDIRTKLLKDNYRNIDYIALSDNVVYSLTLDKQDFVLSAINNSRIIAQFQKGDVLVAVMQLKK